MLVLSILWLVPAILLLVAAAFSIVGVATRGGVEGAPTIAALASGVAALRGWERVEAAQRSVHAAMPEYGFDNGFDTPRQALARGRGYCWQRAAVLLAALRSLGVDARMVHAFRNRFPAGLVAGHVWLIVTIDGESRPVCPGDPRNRPGVVHFETLSKVRRWGPGILALTYLGAPIANVFAALVRRWRGGVEAPRGVRVPLRRRIRGNAMWLFAPILAWNVALAPRLPPVFADDSAVPWAVLVLEAVGRVVVFAAPLLLVIERRRDATWRAGLALFIGGAVLYGASWLPALGESPPSWLWLGPYVLPALWIVGLGLLTRAGAYVVGGLVFALGHASHGIHVLAATL